MVVCVCLVKSHVSITLKKYIAFIKFQSHCSVIRYKYKFKFKSK